VLADGSIVQEHTAKGVDGLALPGTIAPLIGRDFDERDHSMSAEGAEIDDRDSDSPRHTIPRLGVLFNWEPTRILYVSEPFENRIAVLAIGDDGQVFHVAGVRYLTSDALNEPSDLAPVSIESTDSNFSSNTTLDKDSDFYVANRGNNTIVRMRQDGTVVSVRHVRLADDRPLGPARLNGIATSPNGSTIWVTVTGRVPNHERAEGAVLELRAF